MVFYLFMAMVVGALWLIVHYAGAYQKRGQELYKAYQEALVKGDRKSAWASGLAFYRFCHNGKVTMNDTLMIRKAMNSLE